MNLNISTYCSIENGSVAVNGTEVYNGKSSEETFLKGLYQHLEMNYSKFYKMDNLSKLGVLGIEILKNNHKELYEMEDDAIALVFQSEKGCLESDLEHQAKVDSKSPSPAVFVYTLANIVIGEISIRNKWFGESIFFIEKEEEKNGIKETELSTLINYSKSLILTGKSKVCIVGVLESYKNEHSLNLALVLPEANNKIELNEIKLKKIFSRK